MHRINENYLAILRLELKDLQEDIEVLIEQCTKARDEGSVTNYVFMENLALFRNELLGVDVFGKVLDVTDPGAYPTLDALVEHLKTDFQAQVKARGLAELINIYVGRKLEKVRQYVLHGHEQEAGPVSA